MTQASEDPDRVPQGHAYPSNREIERELNKAWSARQKAFNRVYEAVMEAKMAGWSNQSIGNVIGVTEGAVRQMIKRESRRQFRV